MFFSRPIKGHQRASDASDTHAKQMERNYYDTDADGTNGGTTIDDIILSAYAAEGFFSSMVTFVTFCELFY